jgi:hypothetical protein
VQGAGVAGTPAGGVVSVQGATSGAPVNVKNGNSQSTYTSAFSGYTAYPTPTDMIGICGNASTVVRVTRFQILISSTAGALETVIFLKRSAADTSGTPTSHTGISNDAADAAPSSSVTSFAAAPSTGALIGNIFFAVATTSTLTTAPGNFTSWQMSSGTFPAHAVSLEQPVTLRGTADCLYANFAGAAIPAGFTSWVHVTWTENAT